MTDQFPPSPFTSDRPEDSSGYYQGDKQPVNYDKPAGYPPQQAQQGAPYPPQYGQQAQQAPQYGQAPQSYYQGAQSNNDSTLAIVFALLSIFMGPLLSIPGIIFANKVLRVNPTDTTAKAARIISWVMVYLSAAIILCYVLFFAVAIIAGGS